MRKALLYFLLTLVVLTMAACSTKAAESKSEPATRVVKDAFGEVIIPAKPERMLVLTSAYAENLIEIGVIPHMVTLVEEIEPEYRPKMFNENKVKMIQVQQYEENFELLLEAAPDLIIAQGAAIDEKNTRL
jgi:iron complex transport system substrate-binding protein